MGRAWPEANVQSASIFILSLLSSAVVSVSWSTFGDQLALLWPHSLLGSEIPTSLCLFPPHTRFLYHSSDGPHPFCLPRDCVHQALSGSPVIKIPFNPRLGN